MWAVAALALGAPTSKCACRKSPESETLLLRPIQALNLPGLIRPNRVVGVVALFLEKASCIPSISQLLGRLWWPSKRLQWQNKEFLICIAGHKAHLSEKERHKLCSKYQKSYYSFYFFALYFF